MNTPQEPSDLRQRIADVLREHVADVGVLDGETDDEWCDSVADVLLAVIAEERTFAHCPDCAC